MASPKVANAGVIDREYSTLKQLVIRIWSSRSIKCFNLSNNSVPIESLILSKNSIPGQNGLLLDQYENISVWFTNLFVPFSLVVYALSPLASLVVSLSMLVWKPLG